MLDSSTIARNFAWARAYLAVQDITAATTYLRRVMKGAAPAGMVGLGDDAVRLAEEVAKQHLRRGKAHEAAELLRLATSWARDARAAPSEPAHQRSR